MAQPLRYEELTTEQCAALKAREKAIYFSMVFHYYHLSWHKIALAIDTDTKKKILYARESYENSGCNEGGAVRSTAN